MADVLDSDVRVPQAASVAANRRRTQIFTTTGGGTIHQVRPAPADSACWITIWHNLATNPVCFHAGSNSPTALPAATANDWVIPQNTERNYKLGRGETHIALIHAGGAGGEVRVYVSSD